MSKVNYSIVDRVNDVRAIHIGAFDPRWGFTFDGNTFKTVDEWMARLGNLGPTEMIRGEPASREDAPIFVKDGSTFYADVIAPSRMDAVHPNRRKYAELDQMETALGKDIVWGYFTGAMWADDGFEFVTGAWF